MDEIKIEIINGSPVNLENMSTKEVDHSEYEMTKLQETSIRDNTKKIKKKKVSELHKPYTFHKKNDSKQFRCEKCTFQTNHENKFRGHVLNGIHTRDTLIECDFCSHKTFSLAALGNHVYTRHNLISIVECEYCDNFKTGNVTTLQNHVLEKHKDKPLFGCECCGFKTKASALLREHVLAKHTLRYPKKPHDSSMVKTMEGDGLISNKIATKSLIMTPGRSQAIPYYNKEFVKCGHCVYVTESVELLGKHMNDEHPAVKVFQCKYCHYFCQLATQLRVHMDIKHASDLYDCDYCDFRNKSLILLMNHIEKEHCS